MSARDDGDLGAQKDFFAAMQKSFCDALVEWTQWLAWVAAFFVLFVSVIGWLPIGRDDTDPGKWGARSNIRPRVDALTGCQYLADANGGLTPRLTATGAHMGCRP